MIRRTLFLLTLLFAFAIAPAHALEGWEGFFELSFGDLRTEATDAKKDGKLGVVVMYHFEECPYCARMKRDVLSRPQVQARYRKSFRAIAIDTRGSQQITGFDGRTLPENEYARALGVRATPSFAFYGVDGTLLATHAGAIYDPADFMLLADYVASGAYRNANFTAYKQSKQKRGS